jgi:type I restriction enzyme S subunit
MTELSWPEVTLEDVATDVTVGFVGTMAQEYVANGVPFLRSLNVEPFRINANDLKFISPSFHKKIRKSALAPGDVVIVRTGKPGACAVVPEWLSDANCSDLVVVRPGPTVLPRYLCYVINSVASHHVEAFTVGAVQQHFNVGAARKIRFRRPSLREQDRIVALLGALDDKIELNRRMNETLEAMARAIFQDWFVTFGPTRAKMEGRPPYLAPDLWSLFPDRLDAEGKPEGWVPRQISSLAALERKTVSPASVPDELFDHYSIPAFDAGQTPVREFGSGILSNKTLVPHGAVLLSKLNPEIPRVWLIDADPEVRSICSTEFLVLSPIVEPNRAFLFFVVTDAGFRQKLQAQVTGTSKSHQRVKPQSVLDATIITASPNVMGAFQQQAGPLLGRILANQRESRTLATTRDLLLPRLMSGELRVKDAERIIETAA